MEWRLWSREWGVGSVECGVRSGECGFSGEYGVWNMVYVVLWSMKKIGLRSRDYIVAIMK